MFPVLNLDDHIVNFTRIAQKHNIQLSEEYIYKYSENLCRQLQNFGIGVITQQFNVNFNEVKPKKRFVHNPYNLTGKGLM